MTELEERRAMRSIKDLIELGKRDPAAVGELIDRHVTGVGCLYPHEIGVYYALGVIRGAAMFRNGSEALECIERAFASKLDVSVSDYLGDKRVHART